ncbi:hypothetical protein LAZ67_5002389 [Cordylochernes scorpioides]|uniref:Integrase catalytic domain-containing protein n=1 Tax=Cordylochernes scorpioides TaxID=51811 RepID=A0ABY6KGB8_9ARAC|nr:hypothetical protein LAZ67_5002389 [Cordylochernes scorpioides]
MPDHLKKYLIAARVQEPSDWYKITTQLKLSTNKEEEPQQPSTSTSTPVKRFNSNSSKAHQYQPFPRTAAATHHQQEPHKSMSQPPYPCKICASHQLPNQIHFHRDCPLKNSNHPKRINPDASSLGVAGVLKQPDEQGILHPIGYFSRKLHPYEQNYTASEIETLAIINSVQKFHKYLHNIHFTLHTDHLPLKWIKNVKNPQAFLSNKFKHFLDRNNVKHLLTSAHHPETNEKVERLNSTIINRLRCEYNANLKIPWTKYIPKITESYNETVHTTTGFTPKFLYYGIQPQYIEHDTETHTPIEKARKLAIERTIKSHEHSKQLYDIKHPEPIFKEGNQSLISQKVDVLGENVRSINKGITSLESRLSRFEHNRNVKPSATPMFCEVTVNVHQPENPDGFSKTTTATYSPRTQCLREQNTSPGDKDPGKTMTTKTITSGDVQDMIKPGCVVEEDELIASDNGCGTSDSNQIKRTEGECPPGDIQCGNSTPGILSEILHEDSNDLGKLQCDSVADLCDSDGLSGTTAAIQLKGTELGAPWKCDKARWSKHPEVGAGDPTERDRALDALWKSDDTVCDVEVARNVSAPSSAMQAEKICQECVPIIFVPSPDKVQIKHPPLTKSYVDVETTTESDTSRRFKKITALCGVGTKRPRFEGFGKRELLEQENGIPKEERNFLDHLWGFNMGECVLGGHDMDSVDQVGEFNVKIGDLRPRRERKRRKRNTKDHNPLEMYIAATECSHREFKLSDESILGSKIWPPSCGEPPPCAGSETNQWRRYWLRVERKRKDVRAYLDQNLSGQWIGRRGPIEFPARSPDLTPLDFFLWGTVKDGVYKRKPRNLDILWNEIQAVCREISLDVLIRCTESVVTRTQNCIGAADGVFAPKVQQFGEDTDLALCNHSANKWLAIKRVESLGMSIHKNKDTVALRKFREQIKVELGAKDGEIEDFLLVYMMDEMDLGYNRRELTLVN